MAKYVVVINDDERIDNGDESTFDDVQYEVGELLRSGYFQVESVSLAPVEEKQIRRTKAGKMAFAKAWDSGDASEENINRILAERFDGAPGWEEF